MVCRLDSVLGNRSYDQTVTRDKAARPVQLLRVADCPHADQVRQKVRAAAAACNVVVELEEVVGDYASPSTLVDGRDVTGRSLPQGASCRLDLPTVEQIRAALQADQPGASAS